MALQCNMLWSRLRTPLGARASTPKGAHCFARPWGLLWGLGSGSGRLPELASGRQRRDPRPSCSSSSSSSSNNTSNHSNDDNTRCPAHQAPRHGRHEDAHAGPRRRPPHAEHGHNNDNCCYITYYHFIYLFIINSIDISVVIIVMIILKTQRDLWIGVLGMPRRTRSAARPPSDGFRDWCTSSSHLRSKRTF